MERAGERMPMTGVYIGPLLSLSRRVGTTPATVTRRSELAQLIYGAAARFAAASFAGGRLARASVPGGFGSRGLRFPGASVPGGFGSLRLRFAAASVRGGPFAGASPG